MNALAQTDGDVIDVAANPAHPAPSIVQPHQLAAHANPASPDNLLALAVQRGASLEQLEKFLALKERHDATEARKAFTEDMALAKKHPPTIVKDKHVSFTTQKGTTSYNHATLGNVVQTIVAWLAEYRFSHSWDTKQIEGGRIAVTCTLTHAMGHSESVTLDSMKEDSGTKNNIQAMGSAITYLQRYTLLAITGLATEEQDDDGQGAEPHGVAAVAAETAEAIAGSILDQLLADLKACDTDAKASALWQTGSKSLHATGNIKAYEEFKAKVIAHRTALKAGGAQ